MMNDTYGEISREELAALRADAQTCKRCGMLATVDPAFHTSRYGHAPVITREGVQYRWSATYHGWQPFTG